MYARHFGLQREPFSIAPDPHSLFMSERHREALAHLLYGLQSGGGFVLLTGEIGTGKTTVSRAFLEQVPAHCKVAYVFNPRLSVGELMQTVCEEFGIEVAAPGAKAQVDALNRFLLATHAAGGISVLMIDEAQKLSSSVLEQLRLLTNLETNERKLLQIILIGQPELRRKLAKPELEQLAQRVVARFHLGPLAASNVAPYMQHRLAVAGLQGAMPFEARALRRIHGLTGGVPRRINVLADRALLGAYASGQSRVSAAVLNQAAAEVFDRPAACAQPWAWAGVVTLALLALTLAALWWARPAPQRVPVAKAAASAPPPVAAASAPLSASAATATAATAMPQETAAPAGVVTVAAGGGLSQAQAQRALAAMWGVTLAAGDACEPARTVAGAPAAALANADTLQCFRSSVMTLALLRQLARPGVITLEVEGGVPTAALLLGLSAQAAQVRIGSQDQVVTLAAFGRAWRGDYMSFWRGTSASAAAPWLEQQLQRVDPRASAPGLAARLQSFQRAQGLPADGVAGPMTLMQLNRALGVDEPRLRELGVP